MDNLATNSSVVLSAAVPQYLHLLLEIISRSNSLHDPVTMDSLNSSDYSRTGLTVEAYSSHTMKLSLQIFYSIFVFLLDINSPTQYPAINACSLFLYIYMEFTNPAYSMTLPTVPENKQYSTRFLRHFLFTIDSTLKLIDSQTTEQRALSAVMVLYNGVNTCWFGWKKYGVKNGSVGVRDPGKSKMSLEDQKMEMKLENLVPRRYNIATNANLRVWWII